MEFVEVVQKPFKCPQCETRFVTQKYIKRHIKQQHSDNPEKFKCWFCAKLYQNKANYKVHWNKTHKKEFLLYLEPVQVIAVGKEIKFLKELVSSYSFRNYKILIQFFHNYNKTVIPPVTQVSQMCISNKTTSQTKSPNKVSDDEHTMITHRTYGNPYNKAAFVISTFKRAQLVNLFESIHSICNRNTLILLQYPK